MCSTDHLGMDTKWTTRPNKKCQRNTANYVRGDIVLSEQFKAFCNREFDDALVDDSINMSQNDTNAYGIMKHTTQLINNHYETALPFSKDPTYLHMMP